MNKYLLMLISVTVPLVVGFLSGMFTASGIQTWYAALNKPWFNPPNYLFGPVWTLLYILMGVALYHILQAKGHPQRGKALQWFGIQLFLNFWWSILFFYFQWPLIALLEIALMWVAIFIMIHYVYTIHRTVALLQIPYLLWVSFATLLNASLWWLNRQ